MGFTNHLKYGKDSIQNLAQESGRVLMASLEELRPNICSLGKWMKRLPAGRILGRVGALMVFESPPHIMKCLEISKMPKIPRGRGRYHMTV